MSTSLIMLDTARRAKATTPTSNNKSGLSSSSQSSLHQTSSDQLSQLAMKYLANTKGQYHASANNLHAIYSQQNNNHSNSSPSKSNNSSACATAPSTPLVKLETRVSSPAAADLAVGLIKSAGATSSQVSSPSLKDFSVYLTNTSDSVSPTKMQSAIDTSSPATSNFANFRKKFVEDYQHNNSNTSSSITLSSPLGGGQTIISLSTMNGNSNKHSTSSSPPPPMVNGAHQFQSSFPNQNGVTVNSISGIKRLREEAFGHQPATSSTHSPSPPPLMNGFGVATSLGHQTNGNNSSLASPTSSYSDYGGSMCKYTRVSLFFNHQKESLIYPQVSKKRNSCLLVHSFVRSMDSAHSVCSQWGKPCDHRARVTRLNPGQCLSSKRLEGHSGHSWSAHCLVAVFHWKRVPPRSLVKQSVTACAATLQCPCTSAVQ